MEAGRGALGARNSIMGAAGIGTEERLIAAIAALWSGRENPLLAQGGGDDCAVLRLPGTDEDLLLTVDQVVENRHFVRGRHPPEALGRKALVRSLSDVAAMGGRPACFLQTVCLPAWALGEWHAAFQRGMRRAAEGAGAEEVALAGGDIAGGETFVATTAVVGRVEAGTALLRSGARPGDVVFVSGCLGGSAMGLQALTGEAGVSADDPAVRRHCEPSHRLALGRELRAIPATSAIDLSDGLAMDAARLASASGVAVVIDPAAVPLFPGARADEALRSGEEYELLFTLPSGAAAPAGARVTAVGRVESGSGAWLDADGARVPLRPEGFSHF